MTIRKKLHLSNVLMIVIPVCIILLSGMLCLTFLRNHYFDSLEDMFEYDNIKVMTWEKMFTIIIFTLLYCLL